jgi:hypothetical protein
MNIFAISNKAPTLQGNTSDKQTISNVNTTVATISEACILGKPGDARNLIDAQATLSIWTPVNFQKDVIVQATITIQGDVLILGDFTTFSATVSGTTTAQGLDSNGVQLDYGIRSESTMTSTIMEINPNTNVNKLGDTNNSLTTVKGESLGGLAFPLSNLYLSPDPDPIDPILIQNFTDFSALVSTSTNAATNGVATQIIGGDALIHLTAKGKSVIEQGTSGVTTVLDLEGRVVDVAVMQATNNGLAPGNLSLRCIGNIVHKKIIGETSSIAFSNVIEQHAGGAWTATTNVRSYLIQGTPGSAFNVLLPPISYLGQELTIINGTDQNMILNASALPDIESFNCDATTAWPAADTQYGIVADPDKVVPPLTTGLVSKYVASYNTNTAALFWLCLDPN